MKFKKIILVMLLLLTLLTITTVSAMEDNATDDAISIENLQDTNEPLDKINLDDESSEIKINDNENDRLNEQRIDNVSNSNGGNNQKISSQGGEVLGDGESHSMKITIKPAKVYSNKKFTYTAKLTDNGKPVSGVYLDLLIDDSSDGFMCYGARTNSNGIATFKVDPEMPGKYAITVEIDDYEIGDYAYADSYIKVFENPKAKTKVKAPVITAKYKAKKYFKITVKNYKGKPIKKLKLALDIRTGKKWKVYYVKTNNKGVAKFNVKKLKPGSHQVSIYDENPQSKYIVDKESKIIIKKTIKQTAKKTSTNKKSYAKTVVKGKYKNKKTITVKVKDGKKTIKVKCKYKKSYEQYLGYKYKYGKRYDVYVAYEKRNGMQNGKKGWWTVGTNGGLSDYASVGSKHNKYHPVTKVTLHPVSY